MLIEFRVANFRSIREEQVLILSATEAQDARTRRVEGLDEPLLTAAALYGANASGKSNVLGALAFMLKLIFRPTYLSEQESAAIPHQPFAWAGMRDEPTLFEITFLAAGRHYRYGFSYDSVRIQEEWLFERGANVGDEEIFSRDHEHFTFNADLIETAAPLSQVTRPDALFLSTVLQFKYARLDPVIGYLKTIQPGKEHPFIVSPAELALDRFLRADMRSVDEATSQRLDYIKNLLNAADLGIQDLKVERLQSDKRTQVAVFFQHQTNQDDAWLPFREESQGTRSLLQLAPEIFSALETGGVLLIDELEANLHPHLAAWIVSLFHDPGSNPHNAQLLFTTHDATLLSRRGGEPLLSPDQIWLTTKDDDGATQLEPLTNFELLLDDLETSYLLGRYGAVPILDKLRRPAKPE